MRIHLIITPAMFSLLMSPLFSCGVDQGPGESGDDYYEEVVNVSSKADNGASDTAERLKKILAKSKIKMTCEDALNLPLATLTKAALMFGRSYCVKINEETEKSGGRPCPGMLCPTPYNLNEIPGGTARFTPSVNITSTNTDTGTKNGYESSSSSNDTTTITLNLGLEVTIPIGKKTDTATCVDPSEHPLFKKSYEQLLSSSQMEKIKSACGLD